LGKVYNTINGPKIDGLKALQLNKKKHILTKTFTLQAKLVEEEFTMAIKGNSNQVDLSEDIFCERNSVELNARFNEALMSTCQHLATVLQNLCLPSNIPMVDESMVKIVSWESLFESFVTNLSLDILCQNLFKAISFGVSFVS